jgi:HAD superfamily hydrolase (TIGR01509 family)
MASFPHRVDALLIDLFDTLVTVDEALLPTRELGGRVVPSAIWPVVAHLRAVHPALTDSAVLTAMAAVRAEPPAQRQADEEIDEHAAFTALLRRLGLADPGEVLARRLAGAQMGAVAAACRPVPGARALLAALRAAGVRTAVVSNLAHAASLDPLLRIAAADHLFDATVTSIEVGFCKPDPRPFRAALARLGVEAQHTVHVGDDPRGDVQGAAAVGIHPVWFNATGRSWRGPGPVPTTVADLGDVAGLLCGYGEPLRPPSGQPGSMAV